MNEYASLLRESKEFVKSHHYEIEILQESRNIRSKIIYKMNGTLEIPWDGMYLSNFDLETPLNISGEPFLYHGNSIRASRWKDNFELIVDELKPLFGLNKIGKCKISMSSNLYTLSRVTGTSVSEIPYTPEIEEKIRRVLTFRWILRLNPITEKVILFDPNFTFISCDEDGKPIEEPEMTKKLRQKWFGRVSMDETIKEVASKRSREEWEKRINFVIYRIDSNFFYLTERILASLFEN